ncbi:Enhancer of polycomb-like, N-terminal [Artemisia annua]|uniref:Enhancer of polycomb-like, N-terminal n=1 Tax=Artemisia annua TaxID=35608 RepID=A0A2U1Q6X9_ARTAN|nr:Enhancer of polycomb-like, N-terminal [Artemisia annua]
MVLATMVLANGHYGTCHYGNYFLDSATMVLANGHYGTCHYDANTENSVQSFEKLRQVRRNLEQAKNLLEAVIMNETELLEDSLALPGLPSYMSKFAPSEDEFFDSDDIQKHSLLGPHAYAAQKQAIMDSRYVLPSGGGIKREFRRQPVQSSWLHKLVNFPKLTCVTFLQLNLTALTFVGVTLMWHLGNFDNLFGLGRYGKMCRPSGLGIALSQPRNT